MYLLKKLKVILMLVGVSLLIVQTFMSVLAAPTDRKPRSTSSIESTTHTTMISEPIGVMENLCRHKGKFCEIICKNNPSEGGKMCNCDGYALRSNCLGLGNCNMRF